MSKSNFQNFKTQVAEERVHKRRQRHSKDIKSNSERRRKKKIICDFEKKRRKLQKSEFEKKIAYIDVSSLNHCNFVSFASSLWSSQPINMVCWRWERNNDDWAPRKENGLLKSIKLRRSPRTSSYKKTPVSMKTVSLAHSFKLWYQH